MLRFFRSYLRRYRRKKLVRPWAMAAPILVLLIAIPLVGPVRHPDFDLRRISDEEQARLATVQAIVEQHTFTIDATDFTTTRRKIELSDNHGHYRWYSDQSPMMAMMLSPVYWLLRHRGLSFRTHPAAVLYFLTLLGVTVPAACCAGLVYRMGRLFELPRHWRAVLGAAAVFATGLISYSTVLNPHVPAAAFILASAACLIHLTIAKKKVLTPIWLLTSGFCAALAAAIDPSAAPFLVLFVAAVASLRWSAVKRIGAVLAYAIGAMVPILVQLTTTARTTGDFWQGAGSNANQPSTAGAARDLAAGRKDGESSTAADDEEESPSPTWLQSLGQTFARLGAALLGEHGLLSHFPVLAMGLVGGSMIMHRHWPSAAKVLASATVAGAVFLIVSYAVHLNDWRQWRDAMFAVQWFIVFGPLLMFWSGAWLRRPHRAVTWAVVGLLLAFSVMVSLIGATGPLPRAGFEHYTAADALGALLHPVSTSQTTTTMVSP